MADVQIGKPRRRLSGLRSATAQVMTPASAFTMTSRLVIAFASLASRASAATIAAAYPTALATGHLQLLMPRTFPLLSTRRPRRA